LRTRISKKRDCRRTLQSIGGTKNLPYQAIARGTNPGTEIPQQVRLDLAKDGLDVSTWKPQLVAEKDVREAARVVTFGCKLPFQKTTTAGNLVEWKDIPSTSEDYKRARTMIVDKIDALIKTLTQKARVDAWLSLRKVNDANPTACQLFSRLRSSWNCCARTKLMPPAIKTALSADLPEGGLVALITTDELLKQTFAAFKKGKLEIRPGQANLLALMRRLAPGFMNRHLWKASKKLVPVGV
jgi:hypothetical protein